MKFPKFVVYCTGIHDLWKVNGCCLLILLSSYETCTEEPKIIPSYLISSIWYFWCNFSHPISANKTHKANSSCVISFSKNVNFQCPSWDHLKHFQKLLSDSKIQPKTWDEASKMKTQKKITLIIYIILHILARTQKCLEFDF